MSSPSTDILSTTPAPDKRRSIGARFGGLDAVTAVIALILAIPVLSVFF